MEKLFSITANDCTWAYTKGRRKGGQKKNKTSSAVHCKHPPSNAIGYAEDTRSQHQNKQLAFKRMYDTKEFQNWLKLEIARVTGESLRIQETVEREMKHIKVEVKEDGKWVDEIKQE